MPEPSPSVLQKSIRKALPSGAAGATAMGLNVATLMWLRTTVNYQYRYGTSTMVALQTLYREGGVLRFYRGVAPALAQGPLSRFGDTAANTGIMEMLNASPSTMALPTPVKTGFCSLGAAGWRLFLMPLDTLKTSLQTDGPHGLRNIRTKLDVGGPRVLYHGGLGAMTANIVGYYPWFATYNQMDVVLPKATDEDGQLVRLGRRAVMGFCASAVSDITSNSIRVMKVYKQTHTDASLTYTQCAREIVQKDGVQGLFLRGLGTKLIANGLQGAMFSVLWKTIEPMFMK